jgi:hypothetical protein
MTFKELYKLSPPSLKQIVINQWKAKQNPEFHPEGNALKHIIVVTNRADKQFPNNKNIQLAAYFHDLGKLATAGVNSKTGQPTAYGHEEKSVELVDQFDDFIKQQGADPKVVKFIVSNHMKVKPSTWNTMKQQKKDLIINNPNFLDLEKFSTIDKGGLIENNKLNSSIEFYRMQFLAGIITENVYKKLINEFSFKASPDEDSPGNKQFVSFKEDDKYSIEGNTHSGLSHAIKHYGEFKPDEFNSILNKILEYIKSTPNLMLKNISGGTIASGEAAKKQLVPKTILNTLDFINDKILTNQELTPEEKEIQNRFMNELNKDYEQLVSSYINGGIDIKGKSEDEIKKLIDTNKKIKFKGLYKGNEVEYVLDFSNSGILAKKGDNVSTLFRIDKQGNSLDKIKQYISRGIEIPNPELKKALFVNDNV